MYSEPLSEWNSSISNGNWAITNSKEHLERLSEFTLVLLLGGTLFLESRSWPAVGLALFVVARPVSMLVGLLGTGTVCPMRGLTGWLDVRGLVRSTTGWMPSSVA